ncbi:carbamoyl-phosphate synthase small chain [Candidatus Photodesmus blepharus]|uniref:Carbamoyl phosphate synthase small chain n=1 Tax=Candidatus Photodesmus blepharonis TaxID=1179155 RepID=A0A084CMV8_9GAMM|nr:glutamine-hydrolyzing carbamoyl-phosphate synthase small subunit [Candidatus Photodesmus blepharus]KEY91137.1 carbamoyl-phosphate synthase small chain [Candidatus Photodesmus blepharus]
MSKSALLVLEDGTEFYGISIGVYGLSVGEVVFNTSMTGYQEILTDPSYFQQIITLTYPHIGNTGVSLEDEESSLIHAKGLIIRDFPSAFSSFRSEQSLSDYLISQNVVGIADVDTRKLTRILRKKGSQNGCIISGEKPDRMLALSEARKFPGLKGMELAKEITTKEIYCWKQGSWRFDRGFSEVEDEKLPYHIVVYDFGVKRNILRMLVDRGCRLTVVPAEMSAEDVLELNPDGVFLSNGPGDPEVCTYAIEATKVFLEKSLPIFGICLGHQILALASGAKTVKMKFGHHGANHPVQDIEHGVIMITSQNHSFVVDEVTLPRNLKTTHRSLFDGSVQGIRRIDKPAFSFQGHPEASPGPHDAAPLFDRFIDLVKQNIA